MHKESQQRVTRKFLDHDFSGIVAQAAEKRAAEYESVFAQAGVGPEVAEQLKTHVAKIHRASLEAEVALQQVLNARRDYDQRLRSTMTEADYRHLRGASSEKAARPRRI